MTTYCCTWETKHGDVLSLDLVEGEELQSFIETKEADGVKVKIDAITPRIEEKN